MAFDMKSSLFRYEIGSFDNCNINCESAVIYCVSNLGTETRIIYKLSKTWKDIKSTVNHFLIETVKQEVNMF